MPNEMYYILPLERDEDYSADYLCNEDYITWIDCFDASSMPFTEFVRRITLQEECQK